MSWIALVHRLGSGDARALCGDVVVDLRFFVSPEVLNCFRFSYLTLTVVLVNKRCNHSYTTRRISNVEHIDGWAVTGQVTETMTATVTLG